MRRSTRLANSGDSGASSSKAKINGHHNGIHEDKEVYKIDEFVFYETSPSEPYGIGKITDLSKNSNGITVAKLTVFVRRNSTSRHVKDAAESQDRENAKDFGLEYEIDSLPEDVKLKVLQRELFLTKESVTQPISTFRGKCVVQGLCEVDSRLDFFSRNDYFYYILQYDRTLSPPLKFPDRGEIRVGSKYQAEIPALLTDKSSYTRKCENLENLVFKPNHLSDNEIEDFLEMFIGVAISARVNSGLSKYSESLKCAYLASRDSTIQRAYDHLHLHDYDCERATASLASHPEHAWVTDPLESWSDLERASFYKLLRVHKDFPKIKQFMIFYDPKVLVSFYYLWKSTEQAQTYRNERLEGGQKKIKYVSFNSQAKVFSNSVNSTFPVRCDHCKSQISHVLEITPKKLCAFCFTHWKKYYSFPNESQLSNKHNQNKTQASSHSNTSSSSNHKSSSTNGVSKEHIYYRAVNLMKDAGFIVRDILNYKRIAKNPFEEIDQTSFATELENRIAQGIKAPKNRTYSSKKIENNPRFVINKPVPSWLLKSQKKDSGSRSSSKRSKDYNDRTNGFQGNLKRRRMVAPSILAKSLPDSDICFISTERDRQLRKQLSPRQLRHFARNPHSLISLQNSIDPIIPLKSTPQATLPPTVDVTPKRSSSSKASASNSSPNLLPLNHPAFNSSNASSNNANAAAAAAAAALMNPLAALGASNLANFPGFTQQTLNYLQQHLLQSGSLNHFPSNFMNFTQNFNGRAFNGASSSGKHSK